MDHHHLLTIDESRTDWMLKVRVTRIWATMSRNGVAVRHNLILLDCQHNHIHAMVPTRLWHLYENLIVEGGLYRICNFKVTPAAGFFRPVRFPKCITFNTLTVMSDVPCDESMILMHKFKFTPFEDLYEEALGYDAEHRAEYSTDVIGVLGIVQEFQTVETGSGATRVLRFSISDERYRFDVAFWDPLNFDVDPLFENHLDIPVIVILASIRLTLVDGVLTITNISSTKVYINLGHQDIFMMRQRMVNEPFLM